MTPPRSPRLRIAIVAPTRFAIRRPHAGGLESAVWSEAVALRSRGHEVSMIAVVGSDHVVPDSVFELPPLRWPAGVEPTDITYPPSHESETLPALDRALDALAAHPGRYDVISNHCLHPMPIRRAPEIGIPMVTTLHTPVIAEFVDAHRDAGPGGSRYLSVSEHTRAQWDAVGMGSIVLRNGIDPRRWPLGRGGDELVWFGRIVPEKAPHLAIVVARMLGRRLAIAGRVGDRAYADDVLAPLLGPDVRMLGPLAPHRLAALVGRSAAALSTPVWEEPFGLVAPEALMCGTPAVSFAVGGVTEVAAGSRGMAVVPPCDVTAMADAAAALIDRGRRDRAFRPAIRAAAMHRFSLERRIGELERLLASLAVQPHVEELSA